MSLESLVEELGAALQVAGLALNENRMAALQIGSLKVTLEGTPLDDAVLIYSPVGALPESGRESLYATLLTAHLYYQEMGEGCCLGVDSVSGEIVLSRRLSLAGVDAGRLQEVLNEFVNWAEHWTSRLSADGSGDTEESSDQEMTGFIRV